MNFKPSRAHVRPPDIEAPRLAEPALFLLLCRKSDRFVGETIASKHQLFGKLAPSRSIRDARIYQ